jgi:hypothetical protein
MKRLEANNQLQQDWQAQLFPFTNPTHGATMVSCGIQRGLSRGTSQVEPWMGSKTQNIFVCKHDEGVACNDPKRLGGGNIN